MSDPPEASAARLPAHRRASLAVAAAALAGATYGLILAGLELPLLAWVASWSICAAAFSWIEAGARGERCRTRLRRHVVFVLVFGAACEVTIFALLR